MKVNSKGTTLVEILISVILISFIMVCLFNILVDMKEEYNLISEKSQEALNRASYTRIIQNDLVNATTLKMDTCGNITNTFCLDITVNGTKKRLIVDNNSNGHGRVAYGSEMWISEKGVYNLKKITVNLLQKKHTSNSFTDQNMNYHFIKIIIPMSTDLQSNRKLDFELTNVGPNILINDDFCTKISNYIRNNLGVSDVEASSNIKCTIEAE